MQRRLVSFCGVPQSGCFPSALSALDGFPSSPSQRGLRSAHTAIQYRRVTTRAGELDGAKEANGG